jgi:DNA-binding IclR family transcriptional regulator
MSTAAETDPPNKRRIQSIEVGFRVIRTLLDSQRPMPLRDIAAASDMAASKAHLYLTSFVREGMVHQDDETGHYGLGPFAVQLGLSAIRQLSIVEKARPFLQNLSDTTGCGAYLSLLSDSGPSIVSKVDGFRNGALSVRLGFVLPLTTSATGHVFLAYLPEARQKELLDKSYTQPIDDQRVRLSREEVEGYLPKVLTQGYASTFSNINANFAAAATPVFDHTGGIAAAMTILGPDRHLHGKVLNESIKTLKDASAGLSEALGQPS